jgi:hypothetical protein
MRQPDPAADRPAAPMDSRKGTRQPQSSKAAAPDQRPRAQDHQSGLSIRPSVAVVWIQAVYSAAARSPVRARPRTTSRPTVLAAQRQPLQQPQPDQDHRRRHADGVVGGQQPDHEGRSAPSPRWSPGRCTCGRRGRPGGRRPGRRRAARRSRRRTPAARRRRPTRARARRRSGARSARHRAVEVEVVPLEDGAQRRGQDHAAVRARHRRRRRCRQRPGRRRRGTRGRTAVAAAAPRGGS